MANRIKGITVEIGGDTTKLQTALKTVNTQIKSTQSALKDVEKLLKLDPTNTTLLAQKQKLLTQAIGETKEKLATLKTAAEQANEQLQKGEITQEQYDALQREIAETEAELKKLEAQASTTNQTLSKIGEVGSKVESFGNGMVNVGKKVSVASAAVTAMGGAAVKTAADFESSMSQVQATMGITKDSMSTLDGQSVNTMDALSDLAKEMGSKTAFSASECAEALNYLALAGYDTQEMADTLPTVLNLAAAGGIDLASASDMVTDAMSALGMETSEADTMVDQMAKTASSTNTSVSQLGEGILTIGATAKTIKGGTAELNTALGILANNGIKGSEGGTKLRNVILSLQNPTDKAASTMDALGVSVYDSEGNMRSLNDILGDLNTSMDGMTAEEKANIISNIFNKADLSAVNALLANTGDTWDELQTSIENSGGAAQQMADTQLDNLNGQLTILKSAVEGFAISIGEALLPMVKNIVTKIQDFVTWLNNLDEGTKQVIVKIGLFIAALGPALVIMGTVISKVGVAMQAFSKLGLKITSLVSNAGGISGVFSKAGAAIMGINPVVIAVVAIIAVLIGAFVHLWNTNEEFRDKIIAIWERIKSVFSGFAQGIVDRLNALGFDFQNFKEVVSAIWEGLCNFLAPVFEGVFTQIANILEGVLGVITGIIDVFIGIFTGNWEQVWTGVKEIFGSVWDFIKNTFTNYMTVIQGVADVVLGWFGTSWNEVWTGIRDFFVNLWTGIVEFFTGLWEGIKNVVQTAIMFIAALFEAAVEIITLPFRFIWENCKEIIIAVWDAIKEKVSTVINAVSTVISTVLTAIQTVFSTVWNAIKTVVTTVINAIKTTVTTVFNAIKTTATTVWNAIKTAITTPINAVKTTVSTVFNSVKSTVSSVFNSIKSTATSVWNGIKTAITTPIEAAKNKVKGVVDAIKGFFSGMHISLPHIKLPHFKVSGSLSIAPPSVPHLSIDWYKNGGIMTRPTIFGMNGSSLMAGGEAGQEAILPLSGFYKQLEAMIDSKMNTAGMEKYLAIIADNSSKGIYLEDGTLVGHLLPAIDDGLGKQQKLTRRLAL
ncbi:TPA: phage tail tape measure protein [Streptococcus equi subsp. zooepidemicus]|uniref:phage tail tape measure protein n=1 Tax=Streptococcus equi TaxID=1336 RepID=UPI001E4F0E11|nr:phage tail tape measure protein [Streptococcus equi]MCD3467289.1 phage tail tape measure protein [Streptococcus equi subsp. zooepidemicus]HEL0548249.1 phage tail tape measure protein [Streptococcus equi subsp. zooepidemicus]HEL0550262.1 phage tail tape measure protein [Streptococcus equi subsp. zooepidemicus]HEL1063105.1 phage tail tape measure protein [Streptococcus equi subsp. zooepidemicus]HEL1064549.1 phage tail tape measure protein [Streptococcus equi subsp. zooepidemicus]